MLGAKGKCVIAGNVCPQNGDDTKGKFCPCWVEVVETNQDTGVVRVRNDCSHRVMLDWMQNAVRGTWTGAAEVSAMRKDMGERLNRALEHHG